MISLPLVFLFLTLRSSIGLQSEEKVPPLLSDFGAYPNVWNLQDEHRALFAPVVKFPTVMDAEGHLVYNIQVLDLTQPLDEPQLFTEDEIRRAHEGSSTAQPGFYGVGRYDEHRIGLYVSEMYDDINHAIDGFRGRRNVHMGIDLEGPLYTPVHAFTRGTVVHVGYNADLGDYGYVIVVEHELPSSHRPCYALYGHLDPTVLHFKPGDVVQTGDVLGRMGNAHENGGWKMPHVHLQVSVSRPQTHDMPGAVSLEDRARALWEYPDPRYIVGALY